MRKAAIAIGGVAIAAAAVSPVWGDNTDTKSATVAGEIVSTLQLAILSNMTMPHIVRPGTAPGGGAELSSQVTMACSPAGDATNTVSYTRNGNPFARGDNTANSSPFASSSNRNTAFGAATATGTCAVLSVTGQANYYFFFTAGSVTNNNAPGATVSMITCRDENNQLVDIAGTTTNQLGGTGSLTVRCGATTTVTSAAPSTYSASFTATVTYD